MFLTTRGLGGSASGLLTMGLGFVARVVRHGRRAVQEIAGVVTEKTKEYYVTAILMTINCSFKSKPFSNNILLFTFQRQTRGEKS